MTAPDDSSSSLTVPVVAATTAPPSEEYYSSDDSGGSDAEAQKKRGNFFFRKKRFDKAIGYFTRAIELDGSSRNSSRLYSNRAMCRNGREEYRLALEDARLAVERDEKNEKGYFQGCKALFALQDWAGCVEFGGKGVAALELLGDTSEPVKSLRGWVTKAEAKLKRQLREAAESEKLAENAKVQEEKQKKMRRLDKGKSLYNNGKLMDALAEFEAVLRATQSRTGGPASADELHPAGEPPALNTDAVVDLAPDREAYSWIGKIFMRVGRSQEAFDTFVVLAKLQEQLDDGSSASRDGLASTYSNIGICAKACGRLDEAIEAQKKALQKTTGGNELGVNSDTSARILQNLGQAYSAKMMVAEARDAYTKSLEIVLQKYGAEHGSVGLAYLCLARLPDESVSQQLELYDRCLKILDVGGSQSRMDQLLKEVPEVPSRDRLAALVATLKTERAKLLEEK